MCICVFVSIVVYGCNAILQLQMSHPLRGEAFVTWPGTITLREFDAPSAKILISFKAKFPPSLDFERGPNACNWILVEKRPLCHKRALPR